MSHVTTVDVQIEDLDALAEACKNLGLELVRDQETYRWYGTHVGDYPLPAGFTVADLGRCSHAIRVPGVEAYEVGVVARRDGKPGFQLIYDFWGSKGRAMEQHAGKGCLNLRHEYNATLLIRKAERLGQRHELVRNAQGRIVKLSTFR